MSDLTKEQIDAKIDEKTIIQNLRVEYNPILDIMKVFTESGVPLSITEKYMDVKNTTNPFLFNIPMNEYSDDDTDLKKKEIIDKLNEKDKFRTKVI